MGALFIREAVVQWATVREDYSFNGACWEYFPHDHARSRAYRWGEDGLLGITDHECRLCFGLALWNEKDPILKERLFGLTGPEGNHGEDVKECYYYLDSTPTHSYMKALYKYPQNEFPYSWLVDENRRRSRQDAEFELCDTGVFNDSRYWDVCAEYAKNTPDDILIRITVTNRGPDTARLHVLPTLWFRNTWIWGCKHEGCTKKASIIQTIQDTVECRHETLGKFSFAVDVGPENETPELLFTENETNNKRLYGVDNFTTFTKDAFHRYIIHGEKDAVNPKKKGTKVAPHYLLVVPSGEERVLQCRLMAEGDVVTEPFAEQNFGAVIQKRLEEANEFYQVAIPSDLTPEESKVSRQSYAGLLWSKQFYHYIKDWLTGDPEMIRPPTDRFSGRNSKAEWRQLLNRDVVSVPDKWENPWYSTWDLAFHMIPMSVIDPQFAKDQLILFLQETYMAPNGQMPACEFALGDVNPPVHALACLLVYEMTGRHGARDDNFLKTCFQKLLINFTWWVNRKDPSGKNVFSGGFLGLDNIGIFDRSQNSPFNEVLLQADGTAWMAFYCILMLKIALILAEKDDTYQEIASKFFEHFIQISDAINEMSSGLGLWDEQDGFYYDHLSAGTSSEALRVRSMVGLVPLMACLVLDNEYIKTLPVFKKRVEWFMKNRKDLATQVSFMKTGGESDYNYLLAIPTKDQLIRVLSRMLDEEEFLSPHGIRSLSKFYEKHPYTKEVNGQVYSVHYVPGESDTPIFGGNSNWRGPIWLCMNYLLIGGLELYDHFYGDKLTIECPTRSGNHMRLRDVALELSRRVVSLFLPNENGRRPCHGDDERYATDPHWSDLVLFYEYFHPETGRGCGVSHKTGWTALVSPLLFKLAMNRRKPINGLLKPQTYFIVTVSILSIIALVTFL